MNPSSPRSRPDHLIAVPASELSFIDCWHPEFRLREERNERKWQKALFFLMREGPLRTLRKWRSKKRRERLADKGVCVIARHKGNGRYYGGFQHTPHQTLLYFLPGAVWEQEPSREELAPIEKLDPFLGHVPKGWNGEASDLAFQALHYRNEAAGSKREGEWDLYAVGCGGYMLSEVLPVHSKRMKLHAAIDVNPAVLDLPELQGAAHRSNDLASVLEADEEPERAKLAYIASYHSWHTAQALDFLDAFPHGKLIIEKPPCITEQDLKALAGRFDPQRIFIAFHRRYAPWNVRIREWLKECPEPVMVDMWVHEAPIGPDHWYFAPNQGTRIAGNLCHWIDLAIYWVGARPERVSVASNERLGPDRSFYALHFDDGSMVHFTPTDLGDNTRGVQEHIRIQSASQEVRLEDQLRLDRWYKGKRLTRRAWKRDKGHERMNRDYMDRILKGSPSPYPREDLIAVTRVQNAFIELQRKGGGSLDLELADPSEKPELSAHAEAGSGS